MIYRKVWIRYRTVFSKPPLFLIWECFLYDMRFLIFISVDQAKYLISRLFDMLGQYYSEDCVFAWVPSLVFALITPQSYIPVSYTHLTLPTILLV